MINKQELLAAVEHLRANRGDLRQSTDKAIQTVLNGLDWFRSLAASQEGELSRRDQRQDAGDRATN